MLLWTIPNPWFNHQDSHLVAVASGWPDAQSSISFGIGLATVVTLLDALVGGGTSRETWAPSDLRRCRSSEEDHGYGDEDDDIEETHCCGICGGSFKLAGYLSLFYLLWFWFWEARRVHTRSQLAWEAYQASRSQLDKAIATVFKGEGLEALNLAVSHPHLQNICCI